MHVIGDTGAGGTSEIRTDIEARRPHGRAEFLDAMDDQFVDNRSFVALKQFGGGDVAARRYHQVGAGVGIAIQHHQRVLISVEDQSLALLPRGKTIEAEDTSGIFGSTC